MDKVATRPYLGRTSARTRRVTSLSPPDTRIVTSGATRRPGRQADAMAPAPESQNLWSRLKQGTRAAHGALDARIMAGQPFADRGRYGQFLLVQYEFHRLVDPHYAHAGLAAVLPDLQERSRLDAIAADLADLAIPAPPAAPAVDRDEAEALGWLYVAEGSSLGAAFLLKWAGQLGLSETFGARHMAAAPEGRAQHWRRFTNALDALELDGDAEVRAIAGANAAFARVQGLVEQHFFA